MAATAGAIDAIGGPAQGNGMVLVHGTSVMVGEAGILLRGRSGAGKSDLALRLIDQGARLVADDQVEIVARGEHLVASSPPVLRGLMEVRGLGLVRMPFVERCVLALAVDLAAAEDGVRLPAEQWAEVAGRRLPLIRIDPFDASAAAKVRLAAGAGPGVIMRPT